MYSGQLGVIYDSKATNRSAAGGGGSHREFFLLLFGRLEVIHDSQPHDYALFFIAIRVRVKYLYTYVYKRAVYIKGIPVFVYGRVAYFI